MNYFWVQVVVLACLLAFIPAVIADRKGHSFLLWWIFGAALFIVALPYALLIKPAEGFMPEGEKKCPQCAELVKTEALKCRFCGFDFQTQAESGKKKCPRCGEMVLKEAVSCKSCRYSFGRRSAAAGILIIALLVSGPVAAQMKSWTDEDGVTHYGNDPRPTKQAPNLEESLRCEVRDWSDAAKKPDTMVFRRTVETALGDLVSCDHRVGDYFSRMDMALQNIARGQAAISGRRDPDDRSRELNAAKRIAARAPLRQKLLLLERDIKDRHDGTLPAWLKDNRDWRYLDKVLGP